MQIILCSYPGRPPEHVKDDAQNNDDDEDEHQDHIT